MKTTPGFIPFEDLDPLAQGDVLQQLEAPRRIGCGCSNIIAMIILFFVVAFANHCGSSEAPTTTEQKQK